MHSLTKILILSLVTYSDGKQNNSWVIGVPSTGVIPIFKTDHKQRALPFVIRSSYLKYPNHPTLEVYTITTIFARDNDVTGHGAYADIYSGGIGHKKVEIRFISQRGYGVNYTITILGKWSDFKVNDENQDQDELDLLPQDILITDKIPKLPINPFAQQSFLQNQYILKQQIENVLMTPKTTTRYKLIEDHGHAGAYFETITSNTEPVTQQSENSFNLAQMFTTVLPSLSHKKADPISSVMPQVSIKSKFRNLLIPYFQKIIKNQKSALPGIQNALNKKAQNIQTAYAMDEEKPSNGIQTGRQLSPVYVLDPETQQIEFQSKNALVPYFQQSNLQIQNQLSPSYTFNSAIKESEPQTQKQLSPSYTFDSKIQQSGTQNKLLSSYLLDIGNQKSEFESLNHLSPSYTFDSAIQEGQPQTQKQLPPSYKFDSKIQQSKTQNQNQLSSSYSLDSRNKKNEFRSQHQLSQLNRKAPKIAYAPDEEEPSEGIQTWSRLSPANMLNSETQQIVFQNKMVPVSGINHIKFQTQNKQKLDSAILKNKIQSQNKPSPSYILDSDVEQSKSQNQNILSNSFKSDSKIQQSDKQNHIRIFLPSNTEIKEKKINIQNKSFPSYASDDEIKRSYLQNQNKRFSSSESESQSYISSESQDQQSSNYSEESEEEESEEGDEYYINYVPMVTEKQQKPYRNQSSFSPFATLDEKTRQILVQSIKSQNYPNFNLWQHNNKKLQPLTKAEIKSYKSQRISQKPINHTSAGVRKASDKRPGKYYTILGKDAQAKEFKNIINQMVKGFLS